MPPMLLNTHFENLESLNIQTIFIHMIIPHGLATTQ